MQNLSNPARTAPSRSRGRPRAFDREAALGAAMRLFWRKGYAATAISDLTAAMGIGATSLYAAFGSKEALYEETLRHYGDLYDDAVWAGFNAAATAREAVGALLVDSARMLTSAPGRADPPGCMATLANDCDAPPELGAMVRAAREQGVARVMTRLIRARDEGELPQTLDLPAFARFIVTLQNGMTLQARNGVGREELEAAARLSLAGWDGWIAK